MDKRIRTETADYLTKELRTIVKTEGKRSDTLNKRCIQLRKQGYIVELVVAGKNQNWRVWEQAR